MKKLSINEMIIVAGGQASINSNFCYTYILVTNDSVFIMDDCSFYAGKVISENKTIHSGYTGSFKWNGETVKVFPSLDNKGACIGSMYIY